MLKNSAELLELVNSTLNNLCSGRDEYKVLTESMKYSLEAGGKRVRPLLCMAFASLCVSCLRC